MKNSLQAFLLAVGYGRTLSTDYLLDRTNSNVIGRNKRLDVVPMCLVRSLLGSGGEERQQSFPLSGGRLGVYGSSALAKYLCDGKGVCSLAYLDKNDRLWALLDSVSVDEGLRLYDAERLHAAAIRLSVARETVRQEEAAEAAEHRVNLAGVNVAGANSGECSRLCRRLMVLFQAEGPQFGLTHEPEIEVSSPGINRHLRLPEHYKQAVHERVKIVFSSAENGEHETRSITGTIQQFDGENVEVVDELSGNNAQIPLASIKKAQVDFKF